MRLCWLTGLSPCLLISIGEVSTDKGEVLRSTLINPWENNEAQEHINSDYK